jgi:V8-like Glu-specific endopeptidase
MTSCRTKKTNGQEFRAKSLDFSRDCLDTVDKITDPAIATAYKQIKPSLGVVYDKYEKRYMCNATIIAPTRILTARHCFFKGSTARKKDALLFFTTSQPETPIPILGMAPEFDTDAFGLHNQANDYVVAVLSSSASTAGWQQFSDKVTWFTNLLIIAGDFNSLNIRHGRSGQAGRTDAIGAEWVNFLSYTPPSTCMVTKLQGDFCMAHACQTIPGMSGAGIFSMAGRVPQLIAVHIGTTYEDQRENSSVCHRDGLGTAVAAAQTNTGRRLDRRAIERIQKSIP